MSPAVTALIIFAIFIVVCVWDKLPMATTAIAACALMVITGVCDIATAFGPFASSTMLLLLGIMVVSAGMIESGVAREIANIVTRVSNNNERQIIAVAYIVSFIMSAFVMTSSAMALCMAFLFGMNSNEIKYKNLVMPTLVAVTYGGVSTLIGSAQQLFANGMIEELGYSFKVFDFLPTGLILGTIGFIYCVFIGYNRGKKIWGDHIEIEDVEVLEIPEKVTDKRKFYIMIAILIFMIVGFITGFISAAMTATVAGCLTIITGCIDQKKAIRFVNWNVLGRFGGVLGLSKVITEVGAVDLMSEWIQKLIGNSLSPFLLFAICVLVAQILSLVLSHVTTTLLVLSFVFTLVSPLNLNPVSYALGITLGVSQVFSSPLSCNSTQMAMTAGYRFKDFTRYGLPLDIVGYFAIIIFVPLFFPLTLG